MSFQVVVQPNGKYCVYLDGGATAIPDCSRAQASNEVHKWLDQWIEQIVIPEAEKSAVENGVVAEDFYAKRCFLCEESSTICTCTFHWRWFSGLCGENTRVLRLLSGPYGGPPTVEPCYMIAMVVVEEGGRWKGVIHSDPPGATVYGADPIEAARQIEKELGLEPLPIGETPAWPPEEAESEFHGFPPQTPRPPE